MVVASLENQNLSVEDKQFILSQSLGGTLKTKSLIKN